MRFFWQKKKEEERGLVDGVNTAVTYRGAGYTPKKAMLLSAVYACVDCISNAVAQLPLEPYNVDSDGHKHRAVDHPSYYLLCKEPNEIMSRFTFMRILVTSMLLRGNAYAYIKRDRLGNATELKYINPDAVTVVENADGTVSYELVTGAIVNARDMLHFLNFTYDGINGISTLENARNTLALSTDSEAHAAGFFRGGANAAGILKVNGTLGEKQAKQLKEAWAKAFNPAVGQPNGVAVLSGSMDYQQITVNPADAQLLETREFNVVDICRFFGVSPVKIGDLSKSSYSTVEATQLAFLTDTLQPILEKMELEFERKLFRADEKWRIDVRFDTSTLLRTDKAAEADYLAKLFNLGALSVNEIRQRQDLQPVDGGDNHFVQVNLQTLTAAGQPQNE